MNQTLKELLKPPFRAADNDFIVDSTDRVILTASINLNRQWVKSPYDPEKNVSCFYSKDIQNIIEFVAATMNEKWECEINKPDHQIITTDEEACPICSESDKRRCNCEEKYGNQKKPTWIESVDFYTCSECEYDVRKYGDGGNLQAATFNYCPNCGQALNQPERK
ncbi:MAG: hypothetical protein FWB73_00250 [Treponema sp.]|nr:hypothetical protein [Treponema sp.]